MNGADVGLIERRRRLRFLHEALTRIVVSCQFRRKEFERYRTAEAIVDGLVDDSLPPPRRSTTR